MKLFKWLLVVSMLCACHTSPRYTLSIYYAKTCRVCQYVRSYLVEEIQETYPMVNIVEKDIDESGVMDEYAYTCSRLQDYQVNDHSGSVPFIVMEDYFAWVGFNDEQKEDLMSMIDAVVTNQSLPQTSYEVYYFEE